MTATPGDAEAVDRFLQQIWAEYRMMFDTAIDAVRTAGHGNSVAVEVLHDRPDAPAASLLGNTARDDIWITLDPSESDRGVQSIEVAHSEVLALDPILFSCGDHGPTVLIEPFRWYQLRASFLADQSKRRSFDSLERWARKWFDPTDEASENRWPHEVQGVIHTAVGPYRADDEWVLIIDLGSAGVEAVWELIEVLATFASEIRLGEPLE